MVSRTGGTQAVIGLRAPALFRTRVGWWVGHMRVHTQCRLEGLQVRMKMRCRNRMCPHRGPVAVATSGAQCWDLDVAHDHLVDDRELRVLTVIELRCWHCVVLQGNLRLGQEGVVEAVNESACERCRPYTKTVDRGTGFASTTVSWWRYPPGV